MATKVINRKPAASGGKKPAAAAKPAADTEAAAAAKAEAREKAAAAREAASAEKRAAREQQEATQMKAIVDRFVNGDEKLSAVAKDLAITPGLAKFRVMQYQVAQGEVPKITGKDDDALLAAINSQRLLANEHSAWGWLAARSGRSEGWIKTQLEAKGLFTPKAENIASKRAAARPAPVKAEKADGEAKPGGRKRVSGNAS